MLRKKNSGFTLIELMVVIVIIGVLASLAIPRFTEASDKAKTADAPRVIASFESGYLAAKAEFGGTIDKIDDKNLVFKLPDSKWFTYTFKTNATDGIVGVQATPTGKIGELLATNILHCDYCEPTSTTEEGFTRTGVGLTAATGVAKKYFANFITTANSTCKAITP